MVELTTYRDQSPVFLAQAREELARGDLYQASEKGWGAAAQMVKAAANQFGWPHTAHWHLIRAVSELQELTGDLEFSKLFPPAHVLHINFYEGTLNAAEIGTYLDDVARFVDKVDALLPAA